MVDRDARNKLAEEIRHFVAGLRDNFEFDRSVWSIQTKDAAVVRIRAAMWRTYDDLVRHRLEGNRTPSERDKETISRCVLFLKSDREYQWQPGLLDVPFIRLIVGALTLGLATKHIDKRWKESGAREVWPFLTTEEYEQTKRDPVYLAEAA